MCKLSLSKLRKEIDAIDEELIKNLSKRTKISLKIFLQKEKAGLKIKDSLREKNLINSRLKKAKNSGLSKAFAQEIFNLIIKESLRVQKKALKKKTT